MYRAAAARERRVAAGSTRGAACGSRLSARPFNPALETASSMILELRGRTSHAGVPLVHPTYEHAALSAAGGAHGRIVGFPQPEEVEGRHRDLPLP